MKYYILVCGGLILLLIVEQIIMAIYYHIRNERIESYKRKHCHDDMVESHFGCSREDFYKTISVTPHRPSGKVK